MSKACAYCGSTRPLTKEHVIPRFIIARRTQKWDTFNQREKVFFQADPQIGDVCKPCNSGQLSQLDAYVNSIWDEYFEKIVMPGDVVTLRYNFDRLARWLLKVSFNAARASKTEDDIAVLRRYVPYMLGNEGAHASLAIYLELMTPHLLSPEEERATDPLHLKELPRNQSGRVMLEPREIRPARSIRSREMTIRILSLHSYYFYLFLQNEQASEAQWKKRRREARNLFPSAKYLPEDEAELTIPASPASFLDTKLAHMTAHAEAYKQRREEYLESLRKRKTDP